MRRFFVESTKPFSISCAVLLRFQSQSHCTCNKYQSVPDVPKRFGVVLSHFYIIANYWDAFLYGIGLLKDNTTATSFGILKAFRITILFTAAIMKNLERLLFAPKSQFLCLYKLYHFKNLTTNENVSANLQHVVFSGLQIF